MELIEQLTSKLGIDESQAKGATGAILNYAKENLGETDFSSILQKIPGASQMMDDAPEAEDASSGGGLMGTLGGMAKSLGGSLKSAAGLAGLTSIFSKLGLGPDMIGKVTETVSGYLGDGKLSQMLGGLFGGKSE